jgi:hypothetical protein
MIILCAKVVQMLSMKTFTIGMAVLAFGGAQAYTIRQFEFNNNLLEDSHNSTAGYYVGGENPTATTATFTTSTIGGQTAQVASFGKNGTFKIDHNLNPNNVYYNGSAWVPCTRVNKYTIIADVKFDSAGSWISYYNTDVANGSDDGDMFFKGSGTSYGAGVNGVYNGSFNPFEWNRIALVVNLEPAFVNGAWVATSFDVYANGTLITNTSNPQAANDNPRFSLAPNGSGSAFFWLFGDNDGDTSNGGLINSLVIADDAATPAMIAALGGPTANGIGKAVPEPATLIILGAGALALIRRRKRA